MSQNINLLEELVVHSVSAFNSKLITRVAIGWILILALIYVLALGTARNKKNEVTKLEASKKQTISRIENYAQGVTTDTKAQKSANSSKLPISPTNVLGFYGYLEDLAKFTPRGIWLEEIIISEEPYDDLLLKGTAVIPTAVSLLIKDLNKSERFRNKRFRDVSLIKNVESQDIDFSLSTVKPTGADESEDEDESKVRRIPRKTVSEKTKSTKELKQLLNQLKN